MKLHRMWVIGLVCAAASMAMAAALSDARDTPEIKPISAVWLTQGSNTIYAGALVAVSSNGVAEPAADTAGYRVVGRAESTQANTDADYLATRIIVVRRGVFRWENGDSITDANIGDLCYVADDQTVQVGASSHIIIAGTVFKVDAEGVWVDTHSIGAQGAATPASLAVSGNATVGGTLGVVGASTLKGNANVAGTLTATGTVTAVGNATVGGTLGVTGVATFTAAPKFTVTTNGSTVVAAALENLPAGCDTNAVFLKVSAGTNSYAVPMYLLP